MPYMSSEHFRRKELEGIGIQVCYQPIGARDNPGKVFPEKVFLCSFDPHEPDTDNINPTAKFVTDDICDGCEVEIPEEDKKVMRTLEGRNCAIVHQAHPSWLRVMRRGINTFVLVDVSDESKTGFAEYFAQYGKWFTFYAEPYVPSRRDPRFRDFYRPSAGDKVIWTPRWRDQTDTIRIQLMKKNLKSVDFQKIVQVSAFDVTEYREMADGANQARADALAELIWLANLSDAQMEEIAVLQVGISDMLQAYQESYAILIKRGFKDIAYQLKSIMGKLQSQYGFKVVSGVEAGGIPRIEGLEHGPLAIPEGKTALGNMRMAILALDQALTYSKHISQSTVLQRRLVRRVLEIVDPKIVREELGDESRTELGITPEIVQMAQLMQGLGSEEMPPAVTRDEISKLLKSYVASKEAQATEASLMEQPPKEGGGTAGGEK